MSGRPRSNPNNLAQLAADGADIVPLFERDRQAASTDDERTAVLVNYLAASLEQGSAILRRLDRLAQLHEAITQRLSNLERRNTHEVEELRQRLAVAEHQLRIAGRDSTAKGLRLDALDRAVVWLRSQVTLRRLVLAVVLVAVLAALRHVGGKHP